MGICHPLGMALLWMAAAAERIGVHSVTLCLADQNRVPSGVSGWPAGPPVLMTSASTRSPVTLFRNGYAPMRCMCASQVAPSKSRLWPPTPSSVRPHPGRPVKVVAGLRSRASVALLACDRARPCIPGQGGPQADANHVAGVETGG
jgi:hypothetical protein